MSVASQVGTFAAPPRAQDPPHVWARAYTSDFNLALTWLNPRTKKPQHDGWNTLEQCIRKPDAAATHWQNFPRQGMGAVHTYSRTGTLDVDMYPETEIALAAVGLDLAPLLAAGVRVQGNPARGKAWFNVPPSYEARKLLWPDPEDPSKPLTVFELRAGAVQDVLPPSIHPETGQPYRWLDNPWDLGGFPPLPPDLQRLWDEWDTLLPLLEAACPWPAPPQPERRRDGGEPARRIGASPEWDAVRADLRRRVAVEQMLAEIGAKACGHSKYLCPFHTEETPSFWTFDTEAGYSLWCDAHGKAPVGRPTNRGYVVGDVIDLYAWQHNLPVGQATAQMARELRISCPSDGPTLEVPRGGHLRAVPPNNHDENTDSTAEEPAERYHLSDMGNSQRFVDHFGPQVAYCALWHCWLLWDGRRWRRDTTHAIYELAKQIPRLILLDAAAAEGAERRALAQWATRTESTARLTAMLELVRSAVPIEPHDLDQDPWLLNVANGTIDLRTEALLAHDPQHWITKLIDVPYELDAAAPLWSTFLERIQPEAAVRQYLQRASGYSATGSARERKLLVPHGGGKNGKGVFLQTLRGVLGEYAVRTPSETFMARRGEAIPNDVAALCGARFVFASETPEGHKLAESVVKDLTGGEEISARFMRAEWFSFRPTFTPWMATNHKPTITGSDEAIWDRLALVPFDVRIPDEEQNPNLLEELRDEYAGILAWVVAGAREWYTEGLGAPAVVTEATAAYRSQMDVLGDFLAECCVASPGAQVASKALYEAYTAWCKASGEEPLSQRGLAFRLQERGYVPTHTKTSRGWRGVGLASTEQQVAFEDAP